MVPSDKIRAFLDSRNASQSWLSEQTDMSKQAVSEMLKTPGPASYAAARAIADVMGCPTDELMDPGSPWPPERVHKVPDLTDEEMELLKIARRVGLDRAAARILLLPEPGEAGRRGNYVHG